MRKQIAKAVAQNKSIQFLISELIYIIEEFAKKNQDYEIQNLESLKVRHLDQTSGSSVLNCLQYEVFDRKNKIKKMIEVFSSERLGEAYFNYIIQYALNSQNLLRSDLVLQVLNSYYLEDEQLYYVVEYECFDFSSQELSKNQIDQEINQYLYQIYQYSQKALSTKLKDDDFPINNLNIGRYGYFTFQKKQNKLLVKLNTVDPFLFQNTQPFNRNNHRIFQCWKFDYFEKNRNFPSNIHIVKQQVEVSRDQFCQEVECYYPQFMNENRKIIEQIIQNNKEIAFFTLQKAEFEKKCFVIRGDSENKAFVFNIQKYLSYNEAKIRYQELNQIIQDLNQVSIRVNSTLEILDFSQQGCFYLVSCSDRNLFQNTQQLSNCSQFFEKQQKTLFNSFNSDLQINSFHLIQKIINAYSVLIKHKVKPSNLFIFQNDQLISDENILGFFQSQKDHYNITSIENNYIDIIENLSSNYKGLFMEFFSNSCLLSNFIVIIREYFQSLYYNDIKNEDLHEKVQKILNSSLKLILMNKLLNQEAFSFSSQSYDQYCLYIYQTSNLSLEVLINLTKIFQENNNFSEIFFGQYIFAEGEYTRFISQQDQIIEKEEKIYSYSKQDIKHITQSCLLFFQNTKLNKLGIQQIPIQFMGQNLTLCLCEGYQDYKHESQNGQDQDSDEEQEIQEQNSSHINYYTENEGIEEEQESGNINYYNENNSKISQDQISDEEQNSEEQKSYQINYCEGKIKQNDGIEEEQSDYYNDVDIKSQEKIEEEEEEVFDSIKEILKTKETQQVKQAKKENNKKGKIYINQKNDQFEVNKQGMEDLKVQKLKNENIFNQNLYHELQTHVILQKMAQIKSNCFCFNCEQNQVLNLLTKNQKILKRIYFKIDLCSSVEQQLINNTDYFDLKNKQNLLEIGFIGQTYLNQYQTYLISDQLQNNMGSINSIRLINIDLQKQHFYKLSRLVNILISEY
ncbi:hypothetical protein ABPG74_001981 [Tetrahymena malaccensis]